MTVTIQQIIYTAQPSRWHRLAVALGMTASYEPSPEWAEFDGDGILAVHRAGDAHLPGWVDLHLMVDDLSVAHCALADFDVARTVMDGVGDVLTVRAASGAMITVSGRGRVVRSGEVSVQPIWFQADLDEPRRILEALGLRPRIESERGSWVEFVADGGGLAALHDSTRPRTGPSFLAVCDLDALTRRVQRAGFAAAVVDEAYGRAIRIPDPDGGDAILVNGAQEDFYGYRRLE